MVLHGTKVGNHGFLQMTQRRLPVARLEKLASVSGPQTTQIIIQLFGATTQLPTFIQE